MLRKVLAIVFLGICFSVSGYAQSITGVVIDSNGDSVAGAKVILIKETEKSTLKVNADSEGRFQFDVYGSVKVSISVTSPGFEQWQGDFDLESTTEITVSLKPTNIAEVVSVVSNYLAGTPEAIERTPGSFQTISAEELEMSRVFNFSVSTFDSLRV